MGLWGLECLGFPTPQNPEKFPSCPLQETLKIGLNVKSAKNIEPLGTSSRGVYENRVQGFGFRV